MKNKSGLPRDAAAFLKYFLENVVHIIMGIWYNTNTWRSNTWPLREYEAEAKYEVRGHGIIPHTGFTNVFFIMEADDTRNTRI